MADNDVLLVNNNGQQWPEQIRVLLVAIPDFQRKKGDSK